MFLILFQISRTFREREGPSPDGKTVKPAGDVVRRRAGGKRTALWIFLKRLLTLTCLCIPVSAYSEVTIRGQACYTYGDSESAKAGREVARSLAIRDALESAGMFLTTESAVKNFSLTEDYIRIISSGVVRNIRVVEHTEEGRRIYETIEAAFDPDSRQRALETRQKLGCDAAGSSESFGVAMMVGQPFRW